MGKMLIDSVKAKQYSMVVGLVFIFLVFPIFETLLLGDILMMIDYDDGINIKGMK